MTSLLFILKMSWRILLGFPHAFSQGAYARTHTLDELRRLKRNSLSLLRQNPGDDDLTGNFRDGEQPFAADLLDFLLGMHPVCLRELDGISGQADSHVFELLVAHDSVEGYGIDNAIVRLERLRAEPCPHDTVDYERALSILQVAECLDAPFMQVKKQNVRIDVAFRYRAALVVVHDVQTPVELPCLEYSGKY